MILFCDKMCTDRLPINYLSGCWTGAAEEEGRGKWRG